MSRLVRVVPAILTDDLGKLKVMVRQAAEFADWVQFDIMDGQFVPSRSITCDHLAAISIKFNWEAHLMVMHPENYLECFKKAGAQKVVFHYEATSSPRKVIAVARELGLKVGLAINPGTPVSAALSLADEVDSVLFLSVNPGFYGSEYIPEVLDKIEEFRHARLDTEIDIDGGIKEANITQVARSGVNIICVGSAIFLKTELAESFHHLQALAEEGSPYSAC